MSRAAAAALAGVVACAAAGAAEVPFLAGRVNDLASLVSPETEARLEARLERLERETGAQVAVLTVESLEGDPIEDFSMRVVETWRLGREPADDGVLLLVARDDRRMRIEVGYGLEGALTDAASGRILDNVLRPAFRAGDFDGGIARAVETIDGVIRGEATAPDEPEGGGVENPAGLAVFALFFLMTVGGIALRALFAPGFQGWFLYLVVAPFLATLAGALGGARVAIVVTVGWLVLYPVVRLVARATGFDKAVRSKKSRRGGTPWWYGGMSGGGFSGGGFGGGFSGGGGSFGGGGASGSW